MATAVTLYTFENGSIGCLPDTIEFYAERADAEARMKEWREDRIAEDPQMAFHIHGSYKDRYDVNLLHSLEYAAIDTHVVWAMSDGTFYDADNDVREDDLDSLVERLNSW